MEIPQLKPALLIIDVQHALFDVEPAPFEDGEVIRRINQLSIRARNAGAPVVFIQHETPAEPLAWQSRAWKLATNLMAAPADHYVRKTTPDAFLKTDLQEKLESLGTDHLIVCGYASEFCVDSTIRSAAARGYRITLAADAHTTHDKAHATGETIRAHENATLPCLTSFGVSIRAVPSVDIEL
jgi:nicotinamidase-related amidase